ncbi:MAG: TIGR04255 family protein [Desulfobacterales bacterium]|nr:TIGR04255 family protein [Desulfobacterales bacterium]
MPDYTVFPNAPITEALLDIRVKLPEKRALADLKVFQDYIKDRFPARKERKFLMSALHLAPEPSVRVSASGSDGYLFESPKEKKIVQARLDGFTFNKLKPYENWESLRSEARELWDKYFSIANPIKVTRIALRYINRIEVPLPIKDFGEYILTNPEVAPDLPQALSGFFMRLVMPNHDIGATAVVTQTMEAPTPDQKLPLILDIDVFRETAYEANNPEMWDEFEKLRIFKNDIFFKSTSEKAKELFK